MVFLISNSLRNSPFPSSFTMEKWRWVPTGEPGVPEKLPW